MDVPPVISVRQLTKTYGRARGVRGLEFHVQRGEIFGFLGPNGAGKTTTIRLLLDLLRPSAGEARLFGQPVAHGLPALRQRCGYLPGNFRAYEALTGAEFLRFAAAMRKAPVGGQQRLIERFQLMPEHLSRRIKHLSHGTLQKLGIVQAFFHEPELLILDEPTIGLDPLMQDEFYQLLREVQHAGRTVLFSSHNLPEVEKVCQRIAIIREGQLVALETLDGLKHKKLKRLHVTLAHPVAALELPGAQRVGQQGDRHEFLVSGALPPLLERLAALPVVELTMPEPDLEEVFMAYYRREGEE